MESSIKVKEVLEPTVKLIFLYFSMHDCAPCLEFTPLLADLYKEQTPNKLFEVVFFSGDKTITEYQ